MKLNFKGLRFNIWLYYILFAIGILVLLGTLQSAIIRPYYRDNKINSMINVADIIEENILTNNKVSEVEVETAFHASVNNNVCAVAYNRNNEIVYTIDSLGAGCVFNQTILFEELSYGALNQSNSLKEYLTLNQGEISELFRNEQVDQEMILYGREVEGLMDTYYLYVNSPVEILDFTYEVFQTQFGVLMMTVLVLSIVISLFLSGRLARPIVHMRSSAKELANGDYKVIFEGKSFTEINELADSLNDATYKLSKVDELRKDLMANVSHDIKTPLTMIKAYAEMIQDISGDNKIKREEHLKVIVDEVEYLDKLVLELSELSKMQSGTYNLNITQFDLAQKLREIIGLCQVLFEQKKMHVELVTPQVALVSADETKIGQVIYNFITNAVKHSDENSNIYITCQDFGDTVRVSVQDEGSGIKEEDIDYIWDRYYKIDKGFKRSSKGTGLGLAIVKAILDTHEATYGVQSKVGDGSNFYFELKKEDAK